MVDFNRFYAHDRLVRRQKDTRAGGRNGERALRRAAVSAATTAVTTGATVPAAVATTTAAVVTSKTTTDRGPRTQTTTIASATSAAATTAAKTTSASNVPVVNSSTTSASSSTKAAAATSSATAATSKAATSTGGSSANKSASASSSSSSSAANASASQGATTTSHTGTIVAVVVVVVVVVGGALAAFFGYRKYKANRAARGSGTALVGGGGGGFRRQKEDDDEVFGGNFGATAEKNTFGGGAGAYGSVGTNSPNVFADNSASAGGAGMAGMGVRDFQNPERPMRQQPYGQQPIRASWDTAPSSGFASPPSGSYPPSSVGSTAQLLGDQHRSMFEESSGPYPPMPVVIETPTDGAKSPFGGHPAEGQIHIVRNTFEPSQSDELTIYPGDRIQVLVAYDDGWASGFNLDGGSPPPKGVFPFDCVGPALPAGGDLPPPALSATASAASQFPQPPQGLSEQRPAIPLTPVVEESGSPSLAPTSSPLVDAGFRSSGQAAPQLAPLRSDSPLNFGPSSVSPLNFTPSSIPPAIQVSQDAPAASSTPKQSDLPPSLQIGGLDVGEKSKRTSSLIASRDADLFVALGEVLGRDDVTA